MALDKNSAMRLRRVATHIDKMLDSLHQANGFLYPQPMKGYREDLEKILQLVSRFADRLDREIPASKGGRPPKVREFDDEAAA